ncbi:MAG: class I SAM-dependent methyltransferase [Polyangiaceae bacterium]|nr:class I SAM-dependent methyltransferase [Polyangiaceae bacterium]
MLLRIVAQQFRQPSGLLGRVWGRMMNWGNAESIRESIAELNVGRSHRSLEVGFGGGLGLDLLLAAAAEGLVVGAELSDVMLAQAERRFAGDIARGRLRLVHTAIEFLPFVDGSFDRLLTVNTVYFWGDLSRGLGECHRVLAPRGRLVLALRDPESLGRIPFTRHGFTLHEPAALAHEVERAGFGPVRIVAHGSGRSTRHCVVADRE